MRKLLVLALMVSVCSVSSLKAQNSYYVFNGANLQTVHDNPGRASCSGWEIWLFKEGSPQSPLSSRWGTIEGKSAQSVTAQLKSAQNLERAYDKFFGLGSWGPDTEFNSLGPICLAGSYAKPEALEKLDKLNELWERMNRVLSVLQPVLKDWNCSFLRESNPCKLYYGDSALKRQLDAILNASKQISRLYGMMSRGLTPSMQQIDSAFAQANQELTAAENNAPTISSRFSGVSAPRPSLDTGWMSNPYASLPGGIDPHNGLRETIAENGDGITIRDDSTRGVMKGSFANYNVSFSSIESVVAPECGEPDQCTVGLLSSRGFTEEHGGGEDPISHVPTPSGTSVITYISLYFPNLAMAQAAYTYFKFHSKQ